jgi:hypothetical protein
MPDTNIHRGDEELGGVQPHKYYHNVKPCTDLLVAVFILFHFGEFLYLHELIWELPSTSNL